MEAWDELERVQSRVLERISNLELALLDRSFCPSPFSVSGQPSPSLAVADSDSASGSGAGAGTEARLSAILRSNGVADFAFKRVPGDYYDRSYEERRRILGAHSIDHLCKSIVMVNTQAPSTVIDCKDRNNSKYYVVVVQYTARLNAEALKNYLYALNDGKVPKKKFNLRLAPEETSLMLTGFEHNAVTCIGMKTEIPVILDEAIVKLNPDFFWLGGGEVDLKLGIRTSQFIDCVKPFIVCCSM
ncbi:hypothetical protein EUGRSUZ_E00435 [Eucalyptus grandis]|uniref:YbaK/aminoacyl-tRNA synthetase-associated domain-containing protein n=2 Tax=Eucalyptus grandis TaxID=71139 RepID=A0A059C0V4_EUCGR|nr:hypothetical protein EUGRSUZ_E00435 [Eucalyptus grandis]